jgi:hypothetical protein
MVIDVLVRAVTTPPLPMAHPGPIAPFGVGVESCAPALVCPVLFAIGDALATAALTPTAPSAATAVMPTRFTSFFLVVRYIRQPFSKCLKIFETLPSC